MLDKDIKVGAKYSIYFAPASVFFMRTDKRSPKT